MQISLFIALVMFAFSAFAAPITIREGVANNAPPPGQWRIFGGEGLDAQVQACVTLAGGLMTCWDLDPNTAQLCRKTRNTLACSQIDGVAK